jgi:hypothetical protein
LSLSITRLRKVYNGIRSSLNDTNIISTKKPIIIIQLKKN